MEYRPWNRPGFYIYPLLEVQPDVRIYGYAAAFHSPMAAEYGLRSYRGLPLQGRSEIKIRLTCKSQPDSIICLRLVYEDIPAEYILDLSSLETLDVIVELE